MANRLRKIRESKGLTLEEVGKEVGLATNTISRYETGKREPKLETWQQLADFFGVSVPYLQGISNYKDYEQNKSSFKEDLYKNIMNNISFVDNETSRKVDDKTIKTAKKDIASIFIERFVNIFDATIKNVDMGTYLKDRYISLAKDISNIEDINKINATITRGLMLALEAEIDPEAKKRFEKINEIIFSYRFSDDKKN